MARSRLQELSETLCYEVDSALETGPVDAAQRETIHERLQEILTVAATEKQLRDAERGSLMKVYNECLVKLRDTNDR